MLPWRNNVKYLRNNSNKIKFYFLRSLSLLYLLLNSNKQSILVIIKSKQNNRVSRDFICVKLRIQVCMRIHYCIFLLYRSILAYIEQLKYIWKVDEHPTTSKQDSTANDFFFHFFSFISNLIKK